MRFAIVTNELVENIIVADQDFIDVHYPNAINVDDKNCGIGWSYADGQFIAPPFVRNMEEVTS